MGKFSIFATVFLLIPNTVFSAKYTYIEEKKPENISACIVYENILEFNRKTNTVITESSDKTVKLDLKSNNLIIDMVHKIETFVENNKSYVLDSAMKLLYDI